MSSLQQNWRKEKNSFCLEVRGIGGRGRGQIKDGISDLMILKLKIDQE
jgi:hypothetical protein